ncbi:helix-turn-helix domain-containing protein [Streptomyces sp. WI04-05B]|uniref:helix-turn-helix domain-containing protein n=1 Tax=Streptomyces TaxID=1883 RepID=UPI0029B169A3|nr:MULTISPECIES: helix-turn-helix domain-containing protein [unclassified Streptomyces]MDX2543636.1 helix-turn-helix domain-containing protein [Streptomyces sp. WI04-05B]MDX2582876.1 helix-turn-helix domain-containing protein [Streptomyces sp. WI04-05A]MDX3746809.1 helix-turn-helix domain-containing protein [Streptomyces sp. AK08-02]
MKELAGRLTALDPDAGAAVRVIAYFDRLAEHRAGLEALVRGVAVLAGCPARLADDGRRVRLRVETDGRRRDTDQPPDPAWPSASLSPDGDPALWLERAGAPTVVDAVILERAAAAIRVVIDRTRGRAPAAPADDPALVETLLDATAPEQVRLHAARRLGLDPGALARAVAPLDGPPRVLAAGEPRRADSPAQAQPAPSDPGSARFPLPPGRAGVGPAVPVLELPGSWAAARTALRFTADGTPHSPGPRVVYADELGGVGLLAELVVPGADPPPDVQALEAAVADAPWMLTTLHAVASTASLRSAAVEVNVHHSTLQDRLGHAEALLGWPVRTPQGRLRLQLALTMRHLGRG